MLRSLVIALSALEEMAKLAPLTGSQANAGEIMRRFLAAVALAIVSAPAFAADCPTTVDEKQFALDYAAFDAAGWRDLLAKGCADAAIALLEGYRDANAERMRPEDFREINFHIGQTFAFSGRDAQSIPHFEKARGGDEEWSAYVDATLAFLKRNADGLAAARERYERAPNASAMRLAVIDGFIACADKSYREAVHCGMRQ